MSGLYIFFVQILSGLKYIHQENIVHGNLRPSNIFFVQSSCDHLKIGNFGLKLSAVISPQQGIAIAK